MAVTNKEDNKKEEDVVEESKKDIKARNKVNDLKVAVRQLPNKIHIPDEAKASVDGKKSIKFYKAGKRFTLEKIAKATTMPEFEEMISEIAATFKTEPYMQAGELIKPKEYWAGDFCHRGYIYINPTKMNQFFIDPQAVIDACFAIRDIFLSINMTLTDLNNNPEYSKLIVDTFTLVNRHIFNYQTNLSNMTTAMENEAAWRDSNGDYGGMYDSDADKEYRKVASKIRTEVLKVKKHSIVMGKICVEQTESNFYAIIAVVSNAGIRHGKEVANSYRKSMNTLLSNFESTVTNMNADFALRLKKQEDEANLRYDAMESRLLNEIGRLEGVIAKSQALNKKYESSLSSLIGRMEKINGINENDSAKAKLLKDRSKNLYAANESLSSDFKSVIVDTQSMEDHRRDVAANKMSITTMVGIGTGVVTILAAATYYFINKDPEKTKDKGDKNGKRSRVK